jgi:O-antigen/teichoic acid export membrane protein
MSGMYSKFKQLLVSGKTLTKFSAMAFFGQAAFLGIPLILAKFVSPDKFGSYSLGMMVIYLLTTLLMLSFRTPFVKYANEDLVKTGKINRPFSVMLLIWLLSLLVFVLIYFGLRSPLQDFISLNNSDFVFFGLAFLGILSRIFFDSIFLALNRRLENARYWMYLGIIALIYIVIAYFTFKITVASVFFLFFLAPPLVFFLTFPRADYRKLLPFQLDRACAKKILVFGAWVAAGGAAVYLLSWGDNIILRAILSVEDVGVYNLAYQFFKGAVVLTALLNGYFLPFLVQNINNKKKLREYVYKKRPVLLLLGAIITVILALLLPPVITYVYGESYAAAGTVIYFLFVGLIFAISNQLYEPLFNALERYKFIQITNICLVVFNLTLDYFLIVRWQSILGAAVATMLTYILMAVAYEVYYRFRIKGFIITNESS